MTVCTPCLSANDALPMMHCLQYAVLVLLQLSSASLACFQASFHHDFVASQSGRNRIVEVLSQALEECQRRFMNPFQRFSFSKVGRAPL